MSLDTLVKDIYHILDGDIKHEPNEDNLQQMGQNIIDLVRNTLSSRDEVRDPLRFSNLGIPDRQLWYKKHSPEDEEKIPPKSMLKFLYGHIIEQVMILLIKESGHTVEHEQAEVEANGVLGHIDCVVDGTVVDVKSASPYSYRKFVTGSLFEDDPFGYIRQLSGYSNLVSPESGGAFLAFDKVHGDIHLMEVNGSIAKEYQPEPRIEHLKEVLEQPEPPERCYPDEPDGKSGNMKLGLNCSYCGFKNKCWPNLRTFLYSGGPRFLTHVEKVPDVYEVQK